MELTHACGKAPVNLCCEQCPYYLVWGTKVSLTWSREERRAFFLRPKTKVPVRCGDRLGRRPHDSKKVAPRARKMDRSRAAPVCNSPVRGPRPSRRKERMLVHSRGGARMTGLPPVVHGVSVPVTPGNLARGLKTDRPERRSQFVAPSKDTRSGLPESSRLRRDGFEERIPVEDGAGTKMSVSMTLDTKVTRTSRKHTTQVRREGESVALAEEFCEEAARCSKPTRPQAVERETEYIIFVPQKNPPCPVCHELFDNASRLLAHFEQRHRGCKARFQCEKCGRSDGRLHSVLIHSGRCKGVVPRPSGNFKCCECPKSFKSKSGLSQHKRHVHPKLRNEERISQAVKRPGQRGVHRSCWSEEEVASLEVLYLEVKDQKAYCKLIAERLLTKTSKQVSDKIRDLKKRGKWNPVPPTVGSASDVALRLKGPPEEKTRVREVELLLKNAWLRGKIKTSEIPDAAVILEKWACGENVADQVEDVTVDFLVSCLPDPKSPAKKERVRKDKRKDFRVSRRRRCRQYEYAQVQNLFKNDRAKAAKFILDGKLDQMCQLEIADVESFYRQKLEVRRPFENLGQFKGFCMANNGPFRKPIKRKEVVRCLSGMNPKTAPGPDSVSVGDLRRRDPECRQVTCLFNLWYATGIIPGVAKGCRSTLIPKSTDPQALKELGNWRPITVAPVISRLFSKVLVGRLQKACPLNLRQKGFTSTAGCSENIEVVKSVLKLAKLRRKELGLVFIDIAKAFDSVSHEHILWILRDRGLDEHVVKVIGATLDGACTQFRVKKGLTDPIRFLSGVKQGDPLSPILFNIAVDPLISELDVSDNGFRIGRSSLSALAFADDLAVIGRSWDAVKGSLEIVEAFCSLSGLEIQPKKCHGLFISPGVDSFLVNNCPPWKVGLDSIHLIEPGTEEKYLGIKLDPWRGLGKFESLRELDGWLLRTGKAPLKPEQKIDLLKFFILPRLLYLADHLDANSSSLVPVDDLVRSHVKKWLHLPACTTNSLLYCRTRDGGLGIMRLERLVPWIQIRRLWRLVNSEDRIVVKILRKGRGQAKFDSLWKRLNGPGDSPDIFRNVEGSSGRTMNPLVKLCDYRDEELKRWCSLSCQGSGSEYFKNDRLSNAWLLDRKGFTSRSFITALKMRSNTIPSREFLYRGLKNKDRSCRVCHAKFESLSHILGQCWLVKRIRLKRHNDICEILAREAKARGWKVYNEPRLEDPGGQLRKPDLIFVKDKTAVVLDVTVRFEYKLSLEKAREEKVLRYQGLVDEVKRLTGSEDILFRGFPVGCRGKWIGDNDRTLEILQTPKTRRREIAKLISRRAILLSADMVLKFTNSGSQGAGESSETPGI